MTIRLANIEMDYGVAVLLDSLGTRGIYKRESVDEIRAKWNRVDTFLDQSVHILSRELQNHGYRSEVIIQRPYDNLQIFVPVDRISQHDGVAGS